MVIACAHTLTIKNDHSDVLQEFFSNVGLYFFPRIKMHAIKRSLEESHWMMNSLYWLFMMLHHMYWRPQFSLQLVATIVKNINNLISRLSLSNTTSWRKPNKLVTGTKRIWLLFVSQGKTWIKLFLPNLPKLFSCLELKIKSSIFFFYVRLWFYDAQKL